MTSDLLREAYCAMLHNRRRTTLTMLGMAWGIATVVILLAFGSGLERAITLMFSSWGTDVIGVFPSQYAAFQRPSPSLGQLAAKPSETARYDLNPSSTHQARSARRALLGALGWRGDLA